MKVCKGELPSGYNAVLYTLLWTTVKYQRRYCWISQKKILNLMSKYDGVSIWRSTLNVWLNYLEDENFIKRYGGTPINIGGKLVNRATRYYLLPRALNYLKKLKYCVQGVMRILGVRFFGQDKATPKRNKVGLLDFNPLLGVCLGEKGRASPVKSIL
uniref:Uncharacterized protein n=1 Tax=candidate division WOR-3 bacterium TaxID=2052148 RepID=A0A7V3KMW7_UNCW3